MESIILFDSDDISIRKTDFPDIYVIETYEGDRHREGRHLSIPSNYIFVDADRLQDLVDVLSIELQSHNTNTPLEKEE